MTVGGSSSGAEHRWFAGIPGQQVIDGVDRILADTGEDVAQIGFRLKAVHFCGADERVEDGGTFAAGIAASEEPVFSSKAYGPDGVFGCVVRDLPPAIGAVTGECLPARARVTDRTCEIALTGDELQLRVHPDRQCVELRFGLFHPRRLPLGGRLARNRALDLEQLSDLGQRLLGDGRAIAL